MKHKVFKQACKKLGVSVVTHNSHKHLFTCKLRKNEHTTVIFKGVLHPKYKPHLLATLVKKAEIDCLSIEEFEELIELHLLRKTLNPEYFASKTLGFKN